MRYFRLFLFLLILSSYALRALGTTSSTVDANRAESGFVALRPINKRREGQPKPLVFIAHEVDALHEKKPVALCAVAATEDKEAERTQFMKGLIRAFASGSTSIVVASVVGRSFQRLETQSLQEATKRMGGDFSVEESAFQRRIEAIASLVWDRAVPEGLQGRLDPRRVAIWQTSSSPTWITDEEGGEGEGDEGRERKRKRIDGETALSPRSALSTPKTKFSIVVPFRDNPAQNRMTQLEIFSAYMESYLSGLDFEIVIAEQADTSHKFNRGKMLNVGYKIAREQFQCEYHVLHDVDLLPAKDLLRFYSDPPSKGPVHIANAWGQYNYKGYFGGIVSISNSDFEKLNGYPNDYWGWGGEDDELRRRCDEVRMPIVRPSEGTILPLPHTDTKEVKKWKNLRKWELRDAHKQTWQTNGLCSLKYKRIGSRKIGQRTHIITCDIVTDCPDAAFEWAKAEFEG